jgi:hypothetical protein
MAGEALAGMEFSDRPSVLILADSEAGRERALRAANISGCRVSGVTDIDEGVDRLERQAAMDCAFVEIEGDHGSLLDRLLSKLQQGAESGRYGSVIAAPASLIDPIAAKAWHQRVQHLCDGDEAEQAVALGLASARPRYSVRDIGNEQASPRLQQLSDDVRRIAAALDRISSEEMKNGDAPARDADGRESRVIDAGTVRAIIRARRLREQFFGTDLFADPAWDILLDLFAARLEKQRVAVSSLCIAAAVPATTALRWIKTLTDTGLLVRAADPQDGRRVYIELAPQAADGLEAYLKAAQRISPLNL